MVVETSSIYWAALLDGEGWIGLSKDNRPNRSRYGFEFRPRVGICLGKGGHILEELKEKYGGGTFLRDRKNPKWRNITSWQLRSSGVVVFLGDILPYLKIKRRHAELLLEFFEVQGPNRMNALYPEVKQRQIEIYNELKQLNARGYIKPELMDSTPVKGARNYVRFEVADLRRMYWDEKMSMADIAKKFGVSFSTVKNNFDRFGIPRRSRSVFAKMGSDRSDKIRLFASREELVRAYVTEGKTLRVVGGEFGVSHVQVLKAMRRYGIPRRSRKRV